MASGADDGRQLINRARRGGKTWQEEKLEQQMGVSLGRKGGKSDAKGKSGSQSARGPSASRRPASAAAPASARLPQASGGKQGDSSSSGRPPSASKGAPAGRKEKDKNCLVQLTDLIERMREANHSMDYCEKPFFRTALWEATWKNHEDIVKILLDNKARVDKADYQGRTPLHEAAYYGHLRLCDFLVEKGHPVDPKDAFGHTPLFRSVEAGRQDVTLRLVALKADVGVLDKQGVGLQHCSAFGGRASMGEWLFWQGAYKNNWAIHVPGEQGRPPGGARTARERRALQRGAIAAGAPADATSSRAPSRRGSALSAGAAEATDTVPALMYAGTATFPGLTHWLGELDASGAATLSLGLPMRKRSGLTKAGSNVSELPSSRPGSRAGSLSNAPRELVPAKR